ncbi:MAG TPA: class I SAM-dependent methyltransferase [bacterium]|nr:class I SAM-dependent methyltransferase [bacterium]
MTGEGSDKSERYFPATGMPDRDWWQALWPDPDAMLRKVGAAPGLRVIDLCCGDGYFTAPLARIVAPEPVIALDLSAEMLRQARAEAAAQGVSNVTFLEGDARDLPRLVTEPADLVLIANTFHGVPDKAGLAQAVRQVLAPHGRFVVINWHAIPREQTTVLGQPRGPRSDLRMTPASVMEAVRPAVFRQVEVVELPPYHYGIILTPA